MLPVPNVESAVRARYSLAAQSKVEALCCPIDYDSRFLRAIPQEILDRDYGCGDPSKHLRAGETVLDLGSGTGKICFIASQVVGPTGRVIGVDMNDEMLALARRHQKAVGDAIGHHNVEFRKGRIQDLALDLEKLDARLRAHPIDGANAFLAAEALADELRQREPLVATDAVDVVVSNCVLNLVDPRAKAQLFREIFRVLKPGGRAVISDIVSDRAVPAAMQRDPELWSGCVSGAMTEAEFLQAFATAGFHGTRILQLNAKPWRTVRDLEFRSMTVEAFKAPPGDDGNPDHEVIYNGPFKAVLDDSGNRLERGHRVALSAQMIARLQSAPYRDSITVLLSGTTVSSETDMPNNATETSCCNGERCC